MKSFVFKFLKVFGIILLIFAILIFAMLGSYIPGLKNLEKSKKLLDRFNQAVNTSEIIYNTITNTTIQSTISKFSDNGKPIFVNRAIDFSKLILYTDSEQTEMELTYSEYSFMQNSLKNCSSFIADTNTNSIIKNTNFLGAISTNYYNKILLKVDMGDLVELFKELGLIENNLYLSISKNYNGIYNISINNLEQTDSQNMIVLFNQLLPASKTYANYNLLELGKKFYDEYEKLFNEFQNYINISITVE